MLGLPEPRETRISTPRARFLLRALPLYLSCDILFVNHTRERIVTFLRANKKSFVSIMRLLIFTLSPIPRRSSVDHRVVSLCHWRTLVSRKTSFPSRIHEFPRVRFDGNFRFRMLISFPWKMVNTRKVKIDVREKGIWRVLAEVAGEVARREESAWKYKLY